MVMEYVPYIVAGIIGLCLLVLLGLGYVKAPPNMAYIISGVNKKPRVLIGRAGFKIPFLERVDKLWLGQIGVDIKTVVPIPTHDFINIQVDAVSKVQVDISPDGVANAIKNFLNMDGKQIEAQLKDSFEGNLREIVGTLDFKELNADRDAFSDEVMKKAGVDMAKLGITIISCNIQNITDENGLIQDLGAENTSKIRMNAKINKAQAESAVAIAEAEARDKANETKVRTDETIANRETALAIKRADLKTQQDTKQAFADMAYDLQKQEQNKELMVRQTNAEIAKREREVELAEREAQAKEKQLDAQVKKTAEADRYKTQQEAEALLYKRQKDAEASKYERIQEAEARKAQADAEVYEAKQKAEARRLEAEAEAEAIRKTGEAKAKALELEAEAMRKQGEAQKMKWVIDILPQVASEIAKPLAQITQLSVYDTAGSNAEGAVDKVAGYVPNIMKMTMDTAKGITGIDMKDIIESDTKSAQVEKNISLNLNN